MSEKKYICYSDYVYSHNGERHWIEAIRLPELYRVNRDECIFIHKPEQAMGFNTKGKIKLYPDSSGRYLVPEKESQP